MKMLFSFLSGGIMDLSSKAVRQDFRIRGLFTGFVTEWSRPFSAGFFALILYGLLAIARGGVLTSSVFPYYNYLADAFLHGQVALRLIPPSIHDLVQYNQNLYLYWAPFPAILLIPWVALWGVNASDILFTVLVAAVNVLLVASIFQAAERRNLIRLTPFLRGILVMFFALGTVHLTLAPLGRVWFTGQLVAFMCVALAYWASLSLRGWPAFVLAGLAMAGVLATRSHMLLVGIFPAWFLLREHWNLRWKRLIGLCLGASLPIILTLGLMGWYNFARFGNPLEVGLPYHQMAEFFQAEYDRYGAFNLHYLPTNFYYQYIFYPFPLRTASSLGGSLFLLSPLFFAALWAVWQERRKLSTWFLLTSILVTNIPILLLMGTGWMQFGPRYTLDFTVPLLLLTATGMQRWQPKIVALLAAISVLQYCIGFLFLSTLI
jgi:hypothetical protein